MPTRQGNCALVKMEFGLTNPCSSLQGGYFIINGSEKVLIAQERMAANTVYVFAKAAPSPISFLAEIRSAVEKGGKTVSTMQVKMMRSGADKMVGPFLKRSRILFRAVILMSGPFCRDLLARRSKRRCHTSGVMFPLSLCSVHWVSSQTRRFLITFAMTRTMWISSTC